MEAKPIGYLSNHLSFIFRIILVIWLSGSSLTAK